MYYTLVAVLLNETWKAAATSNGLAYGPEAPPPEALDDGTPYECGMADAQVV